MKLKVLVDNNTYIDQYYCGEPAVSYYIEDEGKRLLLDVGYSDLFIKNSKAFGIDLASIDTIVFSHGHDDHTRGLQYYFEQGYKNKPTIVAHPEVFEEKIIDTLKIGSPILKDELKEKSNLKFSKQPIKVSGNITFLGEIPQSNTFEVRKAIGKKIIAGKPSDDYVIDDTALVYKNDKGIYIITGCSHSGLCNIVEYAKKVCNESNVLGIIGGLHLFDKSEQLDQTIAYLKQYQIKEFYPCHCTSFLARAEIHKMIPIKEVGVGLEINW
ncbi:MAG: fold metallo-hydrolase [Firmicutes bacterium]|nr:fold metallo-hydrolase [Bacillota bacterium]